MPFGRFFINFYKFFSCSGIIFLTYKFNSILSLSTALVKIGFDLTKKLFCKKTSEIMNMFLNQKLNFIFLSSIFFDTQNIHIFANFQIGAIIMIITWESI